MSGKKARETRREDKSGLIMNVFGLIEWNAGGEGECTRCHQHVNAGARVTLYDAYSTDPAAVAMAGTLAGELQVDEHMRRVMKAQAAGRFTVSVKRLYCWKHAGDILMGWLNDTGKATMSSMLPLITGKDGFTAMIVYTEPGAWGYTTPSVANGMGKPDLNAIFQTARHRRPTPESGSLTIIEVDD